jgi:hypothetical protein
MRTRSLLCACVALALGLHLLHAARLHAGPVRAAVADGSSIRPAQPAAGDAAALATSPAAADVPAEPAAAHDALEALDAAVVGAHVWCSCITLPRAVGRALRANACLRSCTLAALVRLAAARHLPAGACVVLSFASEGALPLARNWAAHLATPYLLGALDAPTLAAARRHNLSAFESFQVRRRTPQACVPSLR